MTENDDFALDSNAINIIHNAIPISDERHIACWYADGIIRTLNENDYSFIHNSDILPVLNMMILLMIVMLNCLMNYLEYISVSHSMSSMNSWYSYRLVILMNSIMKPLHTISVKNIHMLLNGWFLFRAIMKAHVINNRCWMLANHPRRFSRFPCGIPRDSQ